MSSSTVFFCGCTISYDWPNPAHNVIFACYCDKHRPKNEFELIAQNIQKIQKKERKKAQQTQTMKPVTDREVANGRKRIRP